MDNLADFNQQESNTIERKTAIVKRLQALQNQQDELLSELATLKLPTKGEDPSDKIVIRAGGVTWTESLGPSKIEEAQELQGFQHELFTEIIKPDYRW